MDKPNIGARPYYITAINRINELSKAIYDCSNDENINDMRKWAIEIVAQCDLISTMQNHNITH